MNLDKNTFGNSRAAIIITDLLNNGDPYIAKRVCRLFSIYSQVLNEINRSVKDKKIRNTLMNLWFEKAKSQVQEYDRIPPKTKSFLLNIEKALYRQLKNENMASEIN